jgi:hypothetical protein
MIPGHYFLAGATLDEHNTWAATRDNAEADPYPLTLAIVLGAIVGDQQPCSSTVP